MSLIDPSLLSYFFGPHFTLEVFMATLKGHPDADSLKRELADSLERGEPHLGLHFIGYRDIDTGTAVVVLMSVPGSPSQISFFADSKHRVFGGSSLVCVPLAFCSPLHKPEGDHIVYRHTYKTPKFHPKEISEIMKNGSASEQAKAFAYTKSRDGYETIPGMSYVGITQRSWQERYIEHTEKALEKTSSTRFHEAIRSMQGRPVICVHDISAFGLSKEAAKAYESELIKKSTLWPQGLNMKG